MQWRGTCGDRQVEASDSGSELSRLGHCKPKTRNGNIKSGLMKGITTELAFRSTKNRHEQTLPLVMMTEDGRGEE